MILHSELPQLKENIDEVVPSYVEELSNEDLLELNNQINNQNQDEECEKPNEKVLTLKRLSKAFQLI